MPSFFISGVPEYPAIGRNSALQFNYVEGGLLHRIGQLDPGMAGADTDKQPDLVVRRRTRANRRAAAGIGMKRFGAHIRGTEIHVGAVAIGIEIAACALRAVDLLEEQMPAATADAAGKPGIDARWRHAAQLDGAATPAAFDTAHRTSRGIECSMDSTHIASTLRFTKAFRARLVDLPQSLLVIWTCHILPAGQCRRGHKQRKRSQANAKFERAHISPLPLRRQSSP